MEHPADPAGTERPSITMLLKVFRTRPNSLGKLFLAWHRVPDMSTRTTLMYHAVPTLENEEDTVWGALC